jgi:catechol 2,3-dioxygenase
MKVQEGVSRVSHVALRVTDLERSVDFATNSLGLSEVERVGDTCFLSCSDRHHELELFAADAPGCDHVAFEAPSSDALSDLRDALIDAGVGPIDEAAGPGVEAALHFVGPGGIAIEICAGMDYGHFDGRPVPVRPRKLGHFTLKAEDPPEVEAFFARALGLRLSDRLGGMLMWMRCNQDHHGVGVVTGESGLHHYAFELDDWGSLKALGDHMITRDLTYMWGPGRHGPGNNLFAYLPDPEGGLVEVFTDMLRVESEATYEPRDWPDAPTSLNQWGPQPPPEWAEVRLPFSATSTPTVANEAPA